MMNDVYSTAVNIVVSCIQTQSVAIVTESVKVVQGKKVNVKKVCIQDI